MDDAVLNIIIKARDEASKAVQGVSGAIANSTGKLSEVGKKANQIGGELTKKVTLPLLAAGGASIKFATDFNGAMANIATLIPGNSARVAELKGNVQDMAIEVGKSTADLADGLYNVISAFGDTSDSTAILRTNAKAAAAGMAETTDAINLTSAVTKGYGDSSAKAVGKASDLALLTVRLGQTTFPELAASIGRVTPLAAGLNVKQEELFGTMATFTGVTGGAAEVSTQLRGVLQALMAPTDSMKKLMGDMGYETGEAMIKGEGLQGTIEAITKKAQETGEPLQSFIGSIEGQTLAMAASGGQADNFKEKIKAMSGAAGTTDEAFAEMTGGVNEAGFKMQQARAEMEVMAQKVGDQLAPVITKVTGYIGKLSDWFGRLSPEGQKTAVVIGGLVAAIGPALIVIGKMAQGVSATIKVVKLLGKTWVGTAAKAVGSAVKTAAVAVASAAKTAASHVAAAVMSGAAYVAAAVAAAAAWVIANAAMLGVIGLVIAAVVGLVVVIVKNFDTIKGAISAVWNWVKENWPLLLAIITGPIGLAVLAIVKHWDTIKAAIAAAINWVKANWPLILAIITGPIGLAVLAIIRNFDKIKAGFRAALDFVKGIWNGAVSFFQGIWGRITGIFSNIGRAIGNAISGGFKGIINTVIGLAERQVNGFINLLNGAINIINKIPRVNIPHVQHLSLPRLAKGGVVKSTPGGTAAVLGEAGQDEAVIPLGNSAAAQKIRNAVGGDIGNNGPKQVVNITNNNTFVRDTDPLAFARMQAFELSRR